MDATRVASKIKKAIDTLLKQEVGRFGIRDIRVLPGEDHDGDPVLFVEVDYGAKGDDIDPEVLARLVSKVRNQLWKLGEERFPHVRHHIGEDRRMVGDK